MNEELLDEFIIKRYGDDYAVLATDKAYSLLGLKDKIVTSTNGRIYDTMDVLYYRMALVKYIARNYHIDGLVRTSRGNSHDTSWKSEITLFNNGGLWHDELDCLKSKTNDTYTAKPNVIEKENLTDELLEVWSNTYDIDGNGEDLSGRIIYCSNDSSRFKFTFDNCFVAGTANSNRNDKEPIKYCGCPFYLKQLKVTE